MDTYSANLVNFDWGPAIPLGDMHQRSVHWCTCFIFILYNVNKTARNRKLFDGWIVCTEPGGNKKNPYDSRARQSASAVMHHGSDYSCMLCTSVYKQSDEQIACCCWRRRDVVDVSDVLTYLQWRVCVCRYGQWVDAARRLRHVWRRQVRKTRRRIVRKPASHLTVGLTRLGVNRRSDFNDDMDDGLLVHVTLSCQALWVNHVYTC